MQLDSTFAHIKQNSGAKSWLLLLTLFFYLLPPSSKFKWCWLIVIVTAGCVVFLGFAADAMSFLKDAADNKYSWWWWRGVLQIYVRVCVRTVASIIGGNMDTRGAGEESVEGRGLNLPPLQYNIRNIGTVQVHFCRPNNLHKCNPQVITGMKLSPRG